MTARERSERVDLLAILLHTAAQLESDDLLALIQDAARRREARIEGLLGAPQVEAGGAR